MTRPGPIRVLIAEDHAEYRDALTLVIERADGLELAGTASDALEAVEVAAHVLPDVALIDMRMPGGGGAAAARGIAERSPHTRMIALTAAEHSDEPLVDQVVTRLLKGVPVAGIVEAIKAAAHA